MTLSPMRTIQGKGKLPESYQAAKAAIAACAKVDECKSWADKAAAIESYARQADDETLLRHAQRIKARAIQRCGELLKAFEAKKGKRGAGSPLSPRDQAARSAGLSKDQRKQAQRVDTYAQQDPKGFEKAVEGQRPATVTELARRGTQKKPTPLVDLGDRTPGDFAAATQLGVAVSGLLRYVKERKSLAKAVRGLSEREQKSMHSDAKRCLEFLKLLIKETK